MCGLLEHGLVRWNKRPAHSNRQHSRLGMDYIDGLDKKSWLKIPSSPTFVFQHQPPLFPWRDEMLPDNNDILTCQGNEDDVEKY